VAFVSQSFSGSQQFLVQVLKISATDIAQLDPLEIVPDAFIRIEVGSVAGKLLQMHAFGGPSRQKLLDLMPPVNGRAIPDEQDLAGQLAQEHP